MVRRRTYSAANDECFSSRNKLLSPKTPNNISGVATKFDFSKINVTTIKRRAVSLSDDMEATTAFKRVCRKYTINTEIAEQLAKIGDEIMKEYSSTFENLNVASLYQFFDVSMGVKRQRKSSQPKQQTRKRKISGYLGLMLLYFVSQV